MKEFEKYKASVIDKSKYQKIYGSHVEGRFWKAERSGWKAALEWVLKNSERKGLCDELVCTDTISIIERELDEKEN